MLDQVRVGRQLVVTERELPVLVVPALAGALAVLVVVDPIFGGAWLVAHEGVAVLAGVGEDFVGNLPADDVEPTFALGEELGAALVDDGLLGQRGERGQAGARPHLVQGGETALVGVVVGDQLCLGVHEEHLGVADDRVVGAGVIVAAGAGVIKKADGESVLVTYDKGGDKEYKLQHFEKTNDDRCYNQRCVVARGQKVKKGDTLIEGASINNSELALGRDLIVAFMPWRGYNMDDAIVISNRLVEDDTLTSINIKDFDVEVRETKLGPEQVTRDIPNVSEHSLRHLDEDGIVTVGSEVSNGDILIPSYYIYYTHSTRTRISFICFPSLISKKKYAIILEHAKSMH